MADRQTQRDRALQHLQVLAGDIGARPACAPGEARAHRYAADILKGFGARVAVEPFRSWTSFSWPFLLIGGLALAGAAATLAGRPGWGLALSLAGAALFTGFARHVWEVGRVFPQGESRNVVGIIPPGGAASGEPATEPGPSGRPGAQATADATDPAAAPRRLVLAAHGDSTRSALFWHPRYGRYFLPLFQAMAAAILLLPLPALISLAAGEGTLFQGLAGSLAGLLALPLLPGLGVLVHREIRGQWVPGANDNASGVAVSLAMGEALAARPLEHTEVWVVITGCEEVGQAVGMARFCDAHPRELADTRVVVVDMVGSGQLAYETAEGLLGTRPCDPGIVALMAEIAGHHPDWQVKAQVVPVYNDTQACLVRGIRAGTLGSWAPGYRPYHWPTDNLAHIDPQILEQACAFLLEFARELDARGTPR